MATLSRIICIVLVSQVYVNAAPSDSAIEEAVTNEDTLDQKPVISETLTSLKDRIDASAQGQRQKRFFNYPGYGFPPNGPIYPPPPKRDDSFQTGIYGEDPLVHIYRRLQDIANVVKTPNYNFNVPPPPPLHYPLLVPVFYIPQVGCGCTPDQGPKPPQQPQPPRKNNTDVGIDNRFPEMEDERQNWGFVINETDTDDGQDEDFTRPISFVPIGPPNRPTIKPSPPVDHGSSQAGVAIDSSTTTTQRPEPPITNSPLDVPSTCDGAVLSCCHQAQVSYDCFAVQGCPDPTAYGNPCDPQVILRVIDRFQRFYGQKTG